MRQRLHLLRQDSEIPERAFTERLATGIWMGVDYVCTYSDMDSKRNPQSVCGREEAELPKAGILVHQRLTQGFSNSKALCDTALNVVIIERCSFGGHPEGAGLQPRD